MSCREINFFYISRGVFIVSRNKHSINSLSSASNTCFTQRTFAAANVLHVFTFSLCFGSKDCTFPPLNAFVIKWVKAGECNSRRIKLTDGGPVPLPKISNENLPGYHFLCMSAEKVQRRDSCWLSYCVLGYWISYQHPPHTTAHCPSPLLMCTHADAFVVICTHKDTHAWTRVQKHTLRETNRGWDLQQHLFTSSQQLLADVMLCTVPLTYTCPYSHDSNCWPFTNMLIWLNTRWLC